MRERGEATRPQLAALTGLSLVRVGQIVAALCATGELKALGNAASTGGRPAERYRYQYHRTALFCAEQEGALLSGRLELLDHRSGVKLTEHAQFAMLQEQSLDDWLDRITRRQSLGGITLILPPGIPGELLRRHLQLRYHCPVQLATAAMALADEQEGSLTLYLPRAQEASACIRRESRLRPCGRLALLPQPADWSHLDHSDHTLVEEMIARLLLMLTCTLLPASIVLYADFWTERLVNRIRYNLSTKLRGSPAPRLSFRSINTTTLQQQMRHYCLRCH